MKIAIRSQGKDLDSMTDSRFGRAKYFIVIETDTGEFTAFDNTQNVNSVQGAGIQAAQNVKDLGVVAVISNNIGPKALTSLNMAGIDIYTGAAGSVRETLEQFSLGKLEKTEKATVEGHW